MSHSWLVIVIVVLGALSGCGGGGGDGAINAGNQIDNGGVIPAVISVNDYTLPAALPSVPDQAGR